MKECTEGVLGNRTKQEPCWSAQLSSVWQSGRQLLWITREISVKPSQRTDVSDDYCTRTKRDQAMLAPLPEIIQLSNISPMHLFPFSGQIAAHRPFHIKIFPKKRALSA